MDQSNIHRYLNRKEISFDIQAAYGIFSDKTILITGAGGSIGSELVKKVSTFGCKNLVLLDRSEINLMKAGQRLKETSASNISFELCDVTRRNRLHHIFKKHKPDFVFHSAAYKHVPILENYPVEAVLNNVLATQYIADLCHDCGVSASVFISTDKAVYPTTLLGASKRLGEFYYNALDLEGATSSCHLMPVRFGNVLGSSGSVFTIFSDQISRGGPVTVTDPKADRFFMTAHEAVSLIIMAVQDRLTRKDRGKTYVLDLGDAINIKEIAERMIQENKSSPDIHIEYIGLRSGDKLQEKLYEDHEEITSTSAQAMRSVSFHPYTLSDIKEIFTQLSSLAENCNESEIRRLMLEKTNTVALSALRKAVGA